MARFRPKLPGFITGMGVTLKEAFATMFPDGLTKAPAPSRGAQTVQYPREKEVPATRSRGVIGLIEENCTACMLCVRECPDWCIYIEAHKTLAPPRRAGGKPRSVNSLDRFDIDFSLCMFCGICVEVCPFEAIYWSPEYEYSEFQIKDLIHDKTRLGHWFDSIPEFETYEAGSEVKQPKLPKRTV